jgi:hypothetical protein
MPTPQEVELTGSTDGVPIPVAATATPGTTLHTAGATGYEKVWLWATNVTANPATLTVEWGGVTDPDDHLVKGYSIPANSNAIPIATGFRIQNSLIIRAFSGTASAINISGYAITVR